MESVYIRAMRILVGHISAPEAGRVVSVKTWILLNVGEAIVSFDCEAYIDKDLKV